MGAPNITNPIHASGRFSTAGVLAASVNVVSVTRNGAGDYTIILDTEIDPIDRIILAQSTTAGDFTVQLDPGGDADSQFTFLSRTAAVLTDCAIDFVVLRVSQPA